MWARLSRRDSRIVLALVLSAIAVVTLLPVVTTQSYGIANHLACTGSPVENEILWTPVALLNSPYEGNASVRAVISGGGGGAQWGSITAKGGQSSGMFSPDNWTLERESLTEELGPGLTTSCSSQYLVVDGSRSAAALSGPGIHTAYLSPANLTNDSGVYRSVNMTWPVDGTLVNYSSVLFNLAYSGSSRAPLSFCPSAPLNWDYSIASNHNSFEVPFSIHGTQVLFNATLPASMEYFYQIPVGASGTYGLQDRTAEGGSGLAFTWSACH